MLKIAILPLNFTNVFSPKFGIFRGTVFNKKKIILTNLCDINVF